ncbi:MAG: hypothetical protein WA705_02645 [Candidatus Ozemobacteraceae bacterium]
MMSTPQKSPEYKKPDATQTSVASIIALNPRENDIPRQSDSTSRWAS